MRCVTAILSFAMTLLTTPAFAGTIIEAERASGSASVKVVLMCLGAIGIVAVTLPAARDA